MPLDLGPSDLYPLDPEHEGMLDINAYFPKPARRGRYVDLAVSRRYAPAPGLRGTDQALKRDLYEHLLFQSLAPAFDDVPLRRVFPICLYTPNVTVEAELLLGLALRRVLAASGCAVVYSYEILYGSKIQRALLQDPHRRTREEFDAEHLQILQTLAESSSEKTVINVTFAENVHNYYGGKPVAKPEATGWTESFKNLTEAIENLLVIGVGATLLFDGSLSSSKTDQVSAPVHISAQHIDRTAQLKSLPDVLDADSAEAFHKAIEGLRAPTPVAEANRSGTAQANPAPEAGR